MRTINNMIAVVIRFQICIFDILNTADWNEMLYYGLL